MYLPWGGAFSSAVVSISLATITAILEGDGEKPSLSVDAIYGASIEIVRCWNGMQDLSSGY